MGSTYHLWYAAHNYSDGSGTGGVLGVSIMHATSSDGVSWTKDASPVASPDDFSVGDWRVEGVAEPSVVQAPDGRWLMFYLGLGASDARNIGVAFADDPDGPWDFSCDTKVIEPTTPVVDGDQVLGMDAIFDDGVLRVWYNAYDDTNGFRIAEAILPDFTLAAATGTFTFTGVAAELSVARTLAANVGAFNLTGQDVNLTTARTVGADVGSFLLTGQDVTLTYDAVDPTLSADTGVFSLTGQVVELHQSYKLVATTGSFVLTGQAVVLTYRVQLAATTGIFVLDGQDATLTVTTVETDSRRGFVDDPREFQRPKRNPFIRAWRTGW